MNEGQNDVLRMIRSGRIIPELEGKSEKEVKEQDLILYLTALDAGILIQSKLVAGDKHPRTCPGMRAWAITHAKDRTLKGKDGDPSRDVDIYTQLLDVDNGEYSSEVFWKRTDKATQSLVSKSRL